MKCRAKLSVLITILMFIFLGLPAKSQNENKKLASKLPVKVEGAPAEPAPKGLAIGLRLYGGMGYIGGGDINQGMPGLVDVMQAGLFPPGTVKTGEYGPLHAGINVGCDILVYLQSHWGITLGVDYLKAARTSEITFNIGSEYVVFTLVPRVSAIPIKLGLFTEIPLGRKVNLSLHGGGAYYPARFHYELRIASPGNWQTIIADTSAGGIGFHGGAALEFEISKKLFFFIEALGRYARIDGFTGTETREESDVLSESSSVTIFYMNINTEKGRFHLLMPYIKAPDEPDISDIREAVVDFSGFSARAGLRIKF